MKKLIFILITIFLTSGISYSQIQGSKHPGTVGTLPNSLRWTPHLTNKHQRYIFSTSQNTGEPAYYLQNMQDSISRIVHDSLGTISVTPGSGTITYPMLSNSLHDTLAKKVNINTAIIGATKTKITYDAKGLVTAGTDATTADINDSSNKRYVTDANLVTLSRTLTGTSNQITVTNGDGVSGNPTISLPSDVTVTSSVYTPSANIATLSNLTSNGFIKTGNLLGTLSVSSAVTTINGTTNRLTTSPITNSNGNTTYTLDISSSYVGQSSITTLGTIATGVWNGTVIGSSYGGAGTINGIIKANGSGVTSLAVSGTDYEVPITFSTGLTRTTNTVTVNTSQNISTLSNLTSNGLIKTTGGTGALSIATASTDYTIPADLTIYAPLASPTFTGTVTIPTSFKIGSTTVTTTGTQLNYLNAATGTTGTTSTNLVFSASPTFAGILTSPRYIANNTDDNGTPDAAFKIARSLTLSISQNGHGFRDETDFNRTNFAYASFDGAVNISGTTNINHNVSFQGRTTVNTTGTVSDLWCGVDVNNIVTGRVTNLTGWESNPNVTSGSVGADNRYGFRVKDVTGSGSVGNNYGLYIDNLTRGTSSNIGIYSLSLSYFGARASFGSTTSSANINGMFQADNIGNTSYYPAVFISATAANGKKPTIFRNEGYSAISFSAFSGNFQPAIHIQSDDNSKTLYLYPNGSTNGAFLRTGASGLDIRVGGTTSDIGTLALAISSTANTIFTPSVTTGTGATAGMQIVANSLTTGIGIDASTSSLTTGMLQQLNSTSTALSSNTSCVSKIMSSGTNSNSSATATGQLISVTNTGATSTNIGLQVTASGATNNYAIIVPTAGALVGIGTSTPSITTGFTGGTTLQINDATSNLPSLKITSTNVQSFIGNDASNAYIGTTTAHPLIIYTNNGTRVTIGTNGNAAFANTVTTGTGNTSGLSVIGNSLTTGDLTSFSSTSITTGNLLKLTSTSTALSSTTATGLNIAISGANSNTAVTATGINVAVSNTNATSGTNIAATFSASGATTANYAIDMTAGQMRMPSGSQSLPSLAFTGQTNTGIYSTATNAIAFTTGGAKSLVSASQSLTLGDWNGAFSLYAASAGAGNSNRAGIALNIGSGQSTGSGLGGNIVFQYTPAGGSGTSVNSYSTAATVSGTDGSTSFTPATFTPASGSTAFSPVSITATHSATAAASGAFKPLNITYTINNTGTASTATATGIFLNATETALNSMTHNLMDLQVGSASKFRVFQQNSTYPVLYMNNIPTIMSNSNTTYLCNGSYTVNNGIAFNASSFGLRNDLALGWYATDPSGTFDLQMVRTASNVLTIKDNSTTFNRVNWGGATASFPSIQRSTTTLKFRLADDSADCDISAAKITASAPVVLKGYTVSTLPAGTVGMTCYVTDATAPTYNGALTGGGAITVPVFYNGSAWVSY